MRTEQLHELLVQSLEHERRGVMVYRAALECVQNDELREEFEKYLEQTEKHVRILEGVFETCGLDVETDTPGRRILQDLGQALVAAINVAKDAGDPCAAELVACECVVLAETKDHLDWALLKACVNELSGEEAKALKEALAEIEDEEDEHLYHTKGWCRELWMQFLGLDAVLPPPEERKDVRTAIGAARAEQQRENMR
jgi:rubrerythrin